eukprot:6985-Heterococcus_DN1.PRE.1
MSSRVCGSSRKSQTQRPGSSGSYATPLPTYCGAVLHRYRWVYSACSSKHMLLRSTAMRMLPSNDKRYAVLSTSTL